MKQATKQERIQITDIWDQKEFTAAHILDSNGQITPQGLKKLFEGQVKINGALVDAISAVVNILKQKAGEDEPLDVYGSKHLLKGETPTQAAARLTKKVADIRPPGCPPPKGGA